MSKIKIKAEIKNKNETHTFVGKGILKDNIITYKDENILTKITLEPLKIKRIGETEIEIKLRKEKLDDAIYKTKYGVISLNTKLIKVKQQLK